jgi:hypothetical protein
VTERLLTAEALAALRQRLENPDAVLTRRNLADLGWPRRGIDAIFRMCPTVALPGYSKPLILVADYREAVEAFTYRADRVRPCGAV